MTHEPEGEPENQLTNVVVDPNKDVEKERPHVLIPTKEGNGVSLEERTESLTSPSKGTNS